MSGGGELPKEVQEFMGITGASEGQAQHMLAACDNDVKRAVQLHFDSENSPAPTGAPAATSSADPMPAPILRRAEPEKKKADKKSDELFVGGGQAVMYRDDEEGDDKPQNLFDAFTKAGAKTADKDAAEQRGQGRRLEGSEYQPSQRTEEHVTITVWKNGFSIGDGDLLDPTAAENQQLLKDLQEGRVPKQVVSKLRSEGKDPSQLEVVLTLQNNHERDYVKEFKAFSGSGRTLGGTAGASPAPQVPAPKAAAHSVDDTQEVTTIQICMPDGTRLRARFNLTHTVGDIASFVRFSSPEQKQFSLMTSFPRKKLTEYDATIASAGLAKSVINVSNA
eukprot:TRINITY_DN1595_c0_g1_i1.p2 TRINITY_DN1595_c0_g1~~TRINITY_DN1595_c0_g1_i1.p2  ORF type:complete len:366 (+),score=152.89 TRINITY_DN1595_c0_g1_i1:94-1098(+)